VVEHSPDQIILALSLIDGVGPVAINRIAAYAQSVSWHELLLLSPTDVAVRCGLTARVARLVYDGLRDQTLLERELALIAQHDAAWVTICSANYPQLLGAIEVPPPVLYYRGRLPAKADNTLAIVGSRAADAYGRHVIDQYVPPLVSSAWTIVSGGARGADSMAHGATVRAGGITWAVLGSGLLHPYPRENKKLFDQIVATGGAVMSALPMNHSPAPGNFPVRNRIIAGLSRGCLVVQAGAKSGASITAHHALEQGREVFAVPGPIDSPLSVGCHKLIQEGAKLVARVEDILGEFGILVVSEEVLPEVGKTGSLQGEKGRVLALCRAPQSLPELLNQSGLDLEDLQPLLFDLQLAGQLTQDIAGRWQAAVWR